MDLAVQWNGNSSDALDEMKNLLILSRSISVLDIVFFMLQRGGILAWGGCQNNRDLDDLSISNGCMTRFGTVVHSDAPVRLTAAGWSALYGLASAPSLCCARMDDGKRTRL